MGSRDHQDEARLSRFGLLQRESTNLGLHVAKAADELVSNPQAAPHKKQVEGTLIPRQSDGRLELRDPAAWCYDLAIPVDHGCLGSIAQASRRRIKSSTQRQSDAGRERCEVLQCDSRSLRTLDPSDPRVGPSQCLCNVSLPQTSGEPRLAQVRAKILRLATQSALRLLDDADSIRHAGSVPQLRIPAAYARLTVAQ